MAAIYSVQDLGALVRTERKAQGYTQTELAQICKVSLSFISNLEQGKQTSEMGKALHVIQMLGVDLTWKKRGADL
ncbi:MAG: helix-turn-helix domain-containing protein [Raoultibacter sp.]